LRCFPCDQFPTFCWLFLFKRLPLAMFRTSPMTMVPAFRSTAQSTTSRLISPSIDNKDEVFS